MTAKKWIYANQIIPGGNMFLSKRPDLQNYGQFITKIR